jgi:hypothetical protein
MKLDTAIEVFIREREDLNPDSARRWRLELDLFKEQSGKGWGQCKISLIFPLN